MVANYERDGAMRVDENGGDAPNYWPNSFDTIRADESYKQQPTTLDDNIADWYDRNAGAESDHFTQPGLLYTKAMNDYERHHLVANIVEAMSDIDGPKKDEIILRQICLFFRANTNLGTAVAKGLGLDLESLMKHCK